MSVKTNNQFEILTPTGWQDFNGITRKQSNVLTISFDNGVDICATRSHRLVQNGAEIRCEYLRVGDFVDAIPNPVCITNISKTDEPVTVFDMIEVRGGHQFLLSGSIISQNCDEFSFVATNKASEFFTSIQPTLSTGGACIITSTPKSDVDQFAQIYKGAIDNTDEFGNPNPKGVGKNGFFAVTIPWWHHPERDEEWAKTYRDQLGENRFRQEFACCSSDCIINIENNSIKKDMTMGELFNLLKLGAV